MRAKGPSGPTTRVGIKTGNSSDLVAALDIRKALPAGGFKTEVTIHILGAAVS